ncbi:P-loop containing nucleoside triphosphate hydrolase protein, partial [Aulographum hederae CBS 113979]
MPKFVPRQRKHKVLAREAQGKNAPLNGNSNASEILPESKSEKDERRKKLRDELRAQQTNISSKKQKRLDKYIENKLRKEENLELLKKLAHTKVDTSLFRSSKKLGQITESKRDILSRALRESRAGINVEENGEILYEAQQPSDATSEDENEAVIAEEPALKAPVAHPASLGSGLKRPLELDDTGRPIIKKRQRTKGNAWTVPPPTTIVDEELEWEGFNSEDEEQTCAAGDKHSAEAEERSEQGDGNDESIGSEDVTGEAEDSDVSGSSSSVDDTKERASAFKAWAVQKRNEAVGFVPSIAPAAPTSIKFTPRVPESDPLPPELDIKNTSKDASRVAHSVQVDRPSEIQDARLALPVVAEEQKIMEAFHNNDTIVIWGSTGSGKTTQVPQFLFEAGYGDPSGPTPGLIGITQPRRVAAVSMSKRVAIELGDKGDKVAHQIRFDSSATSKTAIKFMTDGILLREIAQDFALTKYSAIVIDEAHERSVNTDILIGMMSRIVDLRKEMAKEDSKTRPLKLVIMSATLRISDFTENQRLFRKGPPPLVQAEGRQYPVTTHFARTTKHDYVDEAFSKVSRGHKKLPPGAMLVFLTSKSEIAQLAKKLKSSFPSTQGNDAAYDVKVSAIDGPIEAEDVDVDHRQRTGIEVDQSDDEDDVQIHGLDEEAEDEEFNIGDEPASPGMKIHVLPLHSQLPTKQQLRVFEPPPGNSRLIILATNIAETSLTIPGVRYVFDCGRSKEKKYDRRTGVESFEIGWISKASASQRAGRAGRTGPGHCYRLYSSAVYERDFDEYTDPEILRSRIEGVVLQLKSMDLQHVVNFPFPTPPDRTALAKAEKLLSYLGALNADGKITSVGRQLSLYPTGPRFARMLVIGQNYNVTAQMIALVAALEVSDILIPQAQLDMDKTTVEEGAIWTEADNQEEEIKRKRRQLYGEAQKELSKLDPTSDAIKIYAALRGFSQTSDEETFCATHFVNQKSLQEASQLRRQFSSHLETQKPGLVGPFNPKVPKLSEKDVKILKQIIAAGFLDNVAIRADMAPVPPALERRPKRAIDVPYLTLFPSHTGRTEESELEKYVYLHPSSILAHNHSAHNMPIYIIFSHLQKTSSSTPGKVAKVRMHPLTPVSGAQLEILARNTPLLEYGKPEGRIEVLPRGEDGFERRECWVVPSLIGEKGTGNMGWPLPRKRVIQKREGPKGWVLEKVLE